MDRQWLVGRILALAALLSLSMAACVQPIAAPPSTAAPQAASPVEFVRKIDTSAQQIKIPVSLAVDGQGNVYITDGSDTPRVLKYDSQGNFVLAWGGQGSGEGQFQFSPPTPDAGPIGGFVAVDAQGNVYVADGYNYRVQKFDANGKFLMQFGSKGSGEGQFDEPGPGPLYVDRQGNLYVSTFPRVQKFDATGKFLATYGTAGTGAGEFNAAAIGTVDDQGNLYIADGFNHRMQKLDPTGKFLLQWGSEGTGAGQFYWPVAAVLDSADHLYVADNTGRIQIFDTEGHFLDQWSETGAGNPPLEGEISGLAIDQQDNIYVADVASPSIYIFRPRTLTAAPAEAAATAAVPIPDLGDSPLQITSATPYGQFDGIDYVKYTGHFVNTTDGEPFDAPFEIVAPADPNQGNGRLLVEPFHLIEGAGAREKFLTPAFLFGRGFSHAAICWQTPLAEIADHPCSTFAGQPGDELRIIAAFARLLKTNEAAKLVGAVDKLYSIGFSNSADPLLLLLRDPQGQKLFDLSFILNTGWPLPRPDDFAPPLEEAPASLLPAESAGRVIVLLTEADVILWHAALLRDDGAHPNYRSYEVAGASHIPGPFYDSAQLDWLPLVRALFVAGDRWMTEGVEPPPSQFLQTAAADSVDPVYQRPTGVARDENLNAQGGIRLPDLALGRSQFVAVDAANFVLVGTFIDLQCTPLADGSARFPDHATYVSRFTQETQRLVAEGFLLPDEAKLLIEAAQASDAGTPAACA